MIANKHGDKLKLLLLSLLASQVTGTQLSPQQDVVGEADDTRGNATNTTD